MITPTKSGLPYLIVTFAIIGLALIGFRHFVSGVPFFPGAKITVWSVEAKIRFDAGGGSAQANFVLPNAPANFVLINERTASPGFGLHFNTVGDTRYAEWSIREAKGRQTLYYLVEFEEKENPNAVKPTPPKIEKKRFLNSLATAANSVLEQAQAKSVDNFSLARTLINDFKTPNEQAQLLLQNSNAAQRIVELLMLANIPARTIDVVLLEDNARQQSLNMWLQVFDGDKVTVLDPKGLINPNTNRWIVWEQNDGAVFDLIGGSGSTIGFSMMKKQVPLITSLREPEHEPGLLDVSIHSLPLSEQTVFKSILLVPVGVLIVVFMRILIGLKTSGTFMPVLIAIAFMQTSLLTGLIGFLCIVGTGLVLRSYLSRHNLLLVARIAFVILSVILIMAFFSVISFQLGLTEGLKLTLFPMIILSWTIERMSILWEEEGPKEVVRQGSGSLFVAILAYLAMTNPLVRHLTFHFIGLQFIFMALVLWCGTYTGYRFSEIKRFAVFAK
ncbi:MAG: inactive transglutaminase family protein [Marinagarivorans sp.]|nr:inactive transglutaminase family protein [Marinagarivorans sp.]